MFIQLLGTVSIYLDLNSVQNFQLKCLSFFFSLFLSICFAGESRMENVGIRFEQ